MTQTSDTGTHEAPAVEMVTVVIDDVEVAVPKGTLVIRAAELMGVQIPRFCDHPLLDRSGGRAGSVWWRWRASASRWPAAPPRSPTAWWCAPSSPPRPPIRRSTGG